MSPRSLSPDAYQALFESSIDAVLLTVPGDRIVAANPAACAMFQMTEAELCVAERDRLVDMSDPRFSTYHEERARSGKARGELTFRRKDGSTFIGDVSSVLLDEGQRAFVIVRDITERKQREEDLRRAHALLEGITSGTEDMIAAEDGEFRYLFFNEAYRREFRSLWGRDLEVGTSMIEAMASWPEEQRKARELWSRALSGESFSIRMEFGTDLDKRFYDLRFNPVLDTEGRQIGAAHILRNVTEQVRMQQALAESEEQARRIIDNTVALVGIMTPDGTLIEANATALHAGGLQREDVVGKKFWDCDWWSYDVQVQAQLRDAVARAARGETVRYDVVVRTVGDGRMTIDFMLAPARDSAGRITHLIPSAMDITERKEAEEALRVSEAKFRAVFEQAAVGIGRVSFDDARWIDVNAAFCQMLGYTHEEMRATPWPQITHPEDLDLDLIPFRRMAAGELENYSVEKRFIHKNGHPVWARLTLALVRDAEGRPDYEIAVIENITERKRAEEELKEAVAAAEEASRAKSEFLANMSHEIRTPMTVFMAAVEHLLQIDRNPERRQLLNMADQSAERLRALIDDILDFSRIEARKVDLEEEPFDLGACVREAVSMFALQAKKKSIRLEWELAPGLPETIVGDSDRISQVLINLIGNAVKFTGEGEVRVCVQPRGDFVEFAVADTGIGIPEEKRELLFESFTQADSSFTRKFGGTGLGLAISKGLVDLMGGEISVRGREGQGSVFSFTIPLKRAGTQPGAPVEELPGEADTVFAARILLAEDDPMIRDMIALMLAHRGWQAEAAENGREAVEKWERGDFDLLLMDLQMPEMDGLETTRTIRQKESGGEKHTWIIGLTAHARREIKDECLKAGMDKVLTKPIQLNDLYSAISDCLK
ncbi:PAS domain S-box protein [Geoalkalibacter halelectricus]|uniref:histidine kinase n=2 Tax=Geoalkalibacter halelectricus TaxID=2847045 RepID=A0ABY5ZM35_9BACT|nr:PAS domain S-box protein [Geoalkalibacter halelectricus]UWZ79529.1 PAS domain S-box protein [Geoalkalibacter halelectricus]